jgi:hypothetical protein
MVRPGKVLTMLTDVSLKKLKIKTKAYKVADRDGMYVAVAPSGRLPSVTTTVSMAAVRR